MKKKYSKAFVVLVVFFSVLTVLFGLYMLNIGKICVDCISRAISFM